MSNFYLFTSYAYPLVVLESAAMITPPLNSAARIVV